jgi:hydrogenase expression/formation protein HypC
MCLAAPGRVLKIENQNGILMGELDFGGVCKTVCLEYVADIHVGEYAMVHAGFAINKVDEQEVQQFYQLWQEVLQGKPDKSIPNEEPS